MVSQLYVYEKKSSNSINKANKARGGDVITIPGHSVHINCRRDFIHPRKTTKATDNIRKYQNKKCSSDCFNFKTK